MAGGKLPTVTGKQVIRALVSAGFVVDRVVGSHHIVAVPGDPRRRLTVPVHGNRDLKPGTVRGIVRQAGYTVEEFIELL